MSIGSYVYAAPELNGVDMQVLTNKIEFKLGLSEAFSEPISFSTENPARIIIDFPGAHNALSKACSRKLINSNIIKKWCIVEARNRVRFIVNLEKSLPYEIIRKDNNLYLSINLAGDALNLSEAAAKKSNIKPVFCESDRVSINNKHFSSSIKDIGFHRGEKGEGRIDVELSSAKTSVDVKEGPNQVVLRFMNTQLPERFYRLLEVSNFGTPVVIINTIKQGKEVVMTVKFKGPVETRAYQADNRFSLELQPIEAKTIQSKANITKDKTEYTGERLSLNFQDIEVRAVLQLIADFTGLNIVASDTVTGNVTLRLRNVPWDQALAIILKSKGLDKRQMGNVLLVGPAEEMANREKLELQNSQQVADLAPLRSEYIQINYAKASVLAGLLKAEKNSLLSSRGSVSVDERTNMLLVQDTAAKISEIQKLVHRLDIPIRQVLIETRIVLVNDDFEEALGVELGIAAKVGEGPRTGIAGQIPGGSSPIALGAPPSSIDPSNRLAVNLPQVLSDVPGSFGQIAFTVAKLPGGTVLDLELMALEKEGLGKIVSSPRLVTSDQHLAYIESGEEIPYNESTSSGAAAIAFKKAVLRLEVTPQITPDDHVLLDLKVNQDSRGPPTGSTVSINTRELQTKVLVANGETIVLGGIYEQTTTKSTVRVPFLGRLPCIGWLFKSENNLDTRKELMIFVTPKIIKEGMSCELDTRDK